MNRSDVLWMATAVTVHLLLLAAIAWQNGGLEAVWGVHDAVYYTAHLADPLLQGDVSWWGNLTYRAMRVGYILLALPFRWLGVVPAFITVNLAAVAAGTVAIRQVASLHGASLPLASAVWILNPGALMSTAMLLPDTIAWTAIVFSLLAMHHRKWGVAAGLAVLAVVTKEASLAPVGLAGVVFAGSERDWRPLMPTVSAGVGWLLLLTVSTLRFGSATHGSFIDFVPFSGWVEAFQFWIPGRTRSMVVGLFVLASGLFVLWVWWRRRTLFLTAAAGQAVLMLLLAGVVVAPMSNSLRIGGLFWPILAATYPVATRVDLRRRAPARRGSSEPAP